MNEHAPDFKALLGQLRAGSEEAAFALFELYGPSVRAVVRRILQKRLRSRFDSEDVTQDVWASFFANPPSPGAFDRPEGLAGFLARMARHKALDLLRRQFLAEKRNLNREKSLDGSADWVVAAVPGTEPTPSARMAMREKWDQLAPRDRRILELLCAGKAKGQIAAELGVDLRVLREVIRKFFWGERS